MTLDSVPSSPKARKGCSSLSINPPFLPILKNGHVVSAEDVIIGYSLDSTAPSTSQETGEKQDADPPAGSHPVAEDAEPAVVALDSTSRLQKGITSRNPLTSPILHGTRSTKHVLVPERRSSATSVRQHAPSELWEKHLAFQRGQESSKKIIRPSLIQVADEDNPFMVTPVVVQKKMRPKVADADNPFMVTPETAQRKARPKVADEDNPFMMTPVAIRRKRRSKVEQQASSYSSVSPSLFKIEPVSRPTNMEESPPGLRSGRQRLNQAAVDQGKELVEGTTKEEQAVEEKIDNQEVQEQRIPRRGIEAVNPLRPYHRSLSLGSPSFSPSIKRGIQPESRMLGEGLSEDEDDSNWGSSRNDVLLRTPEKKRHFDINTLFSPGSPSIWTDDMTSPKSGILQRIPVGDEQTESPLSPLMVTSRHNLETPKRKLGRIITQNGTSYDQDRESLLCLEDEDDNGDGFESDIKDDGKYTRKPDALKHDSPDTAMFPSKSSSRPWSPRTTPSSKRVKYVYQTPPRKKTPLLSPFKKPPGAPRFSFYSGVIEDQSTRYSPAKQKLDRMRRP